MVSHGFRYRDRFAQFPVGFASILPLGGDGLPRILGNRQKASFRE